MNESHRTGADKHDRNADTVGVFDGIPASMRLYDFGGVIDELCRSLIVPMATFAIVILRGWYNGKKRWPARIIEATLFAIVAKILMPAAMAFYMTALKVPPQYAYDYAFMTCIIVGFVGVDTLSEAARNYFGRG